MTLVKSALYFITLKFHYIQFQRFTQMTSHWQIFLTRKESDGRSDKTSFNEKKDSFCWIWKLAAKDTVSWCVDDIFTSVLWSEAFASMPVFVNLTSTVTNSRYTISAERTQQACCSFWVKSCTFAVTSMHWLAEAQGTRTKRDNKHGAVFVVLLRPCPLHCHLPWTLTNLPNSPLFCAVFDLHASFCPLYILSPTCSVPYYNAPVCSFCRGSECQYLWHKCSLSFIWTCSVLGSASEFLCLEPWSVWGDKILLSSLWYKCSGYSPVVFYEVN